LAALLPLSPTALEEALAILLGAGLLRRIDRDGPPAYAFKHALIREVAYETLLRGRRRKLHARIAEVLEHRFPNTPPDLLAQHRALAGAAPAAARHWLRAGELSLGQAAPAEALVRLSAGLDLLQGLPEGSERRRLEIGLQLARGQALSLVRGRASPEVCEAFGRAHELCRLEDEAPGMATALFGLYGCHLLRAELNEARAVAEELLNLAEWQGDAAMQVMALGIGGSIEFFLGRLGAAQSSLEASLAQGEAAALGATDAATHGFHPRLLSLTYLSWTLLVLGWPDQARHLGRIATAEAELLPHQPGVLAAARFSDGVLCQLLRDRQGAQAQAEALLALAAEQDLPLWLAGGAILHGWSLADRGERVVGIRELRQGLAAWRATGAEHLVPYFLALLAEACAAAGRPAEGLRAVEEGLAQAERTGERWCEPELLRLRGELLLLRAPRHRAAAEASLHRARAVASRQQARLWELRAAASLARLWAGRDGTRVQRILAPAHDWFTEGTAIPDLLEARALLAQAGRRDQR
jgi:predicted ATPase